MGRRLRCSPVTQGQKKELPRFRFRVYRTVIRFILEKEIMSKSRFSSPPCGISKTAGNMALIRALEFLKSPLQRLFSDPYARHFVPARQRVLLGPAHLPPVRALLEGYFDWRAPGARTSGAARTRLIDDWVREALAAFVGQVVILGAGFDCRALRMKELANTPVFEVDRPAMIARKESILAGNHQRPARIRRLGVDFQKDDLGNRLAEAGCSPNLKTLFIWEGVTNYLDNRSVAAVFDFFARDAAIGSRIIFTYVHADLLNSRFAAPGVVRLTAALRAYGEPWTFGLLPEEVPAYLAEKGIRLLNDLGAAEYRAKYMHPVFKLVGYEFYRAALAEKVGHATN
jgi:methyltransferase (TIGR00027 family)